MTHAKGRRKVSHPFEHTFVDLRYLDAKPAGVQLYSTLLLEGLSRTILAGSLTTEQEVGVVLHVYFQALLRWGLWKQLISDHGGQFISHAFQRVNKRLGIHHSHVRERPSVAEPDRISVRNSSQSSASITGNGARRLRRRLTFIVN